MKNQDRNRVSAGMAGAPASRRATVHFFVARFYVDSMRNPARRPAPQFFLALFR
jgi:hypothetical protein